ncbi:MAG: hypothetical protein JSV79_10530 [Armatimonadota bacterium]|nr:MAG: hypothetical protein JSV79_10530 [Armatimonadota bacterium]
MKKNVSPLFALIVIVVALVLGALWFMTRYRAHEIREAQIKRALQQQADQAISSGRRAQRRAMISHARRRASEPERQGEEEDRAAQQEPAAEPVEQPESAPEPGG